MSTQQEPPIHPAKRGPCPQMLLSAGLLLHAVLISLAGTASGTAQAAVKSCAGIMANTEQTFIMIKPDGVARGLVGEIIKRFEQKVCSDYNLHIPLLGGLL